MARITVEDCIDKFPSRFELVLIASNRARKLHSGESPTLEKDNDKNTVIALREIASESISIDELKNDLIEEYQTTTFSEDEELNEQDEDTNEIENNADTLEENSSIVSETNNSDDNLTKNDNDNDDDTSLIKEPDLSTDDTNTSFNDEIESNKEID